MGWASVSELLLMSQEFSTFSEQLQRKCLAGGRAFSVLFPVTDLNKLLESTLTPAGQWNGKNSAHNLSSLRNPKDGLKKGQQKPSLWEERNQDCSQSKPPIFLQDCTTLCFSRPYDPRDFFF